MLDTLLATWGIGILIQQAVRLEFGLSFFGIHIDGLGPGLQNVTIPDALQGAITIGGIDINTYRAFIILVTIIFTLITWFLLFRTSIGTQVRAIIRNRQMAAACGIDVERINALTFAFGAGLAGVAGVMMSGFKTVFPDMGTPMVVDGFLVVVVGGIGSLLGSVLSAGMLGEINGVVASISNDIVARAVVFGVVILIIVLKPKGLFSFEGTLRMTKRHVEIAIYALFIVAIMLAPLVLDSFWVNRLAKYLVFGMLGIAVALSWGYAGVLNLGQGLFFGGGAYMLAMSLKLASQTSLQQGSDKPVPDFMLWNAEPGSQTDLCCINKASFLWIPFQNQWFGVAMGIVLPVCIAAVLGIIMFRKRIAGVFVSIITLALVLLVRLLIIDAQPLTNGFNGLTDLGWFKLFDFEFDPYRDADLLSGRRLARDRIDPFAGFDRNARRPDLAGDPRRPESRALSGLRRTPLPDILLHGLRGHLLVRRYALCDRGRVCLADVHGLELLDQHGRVGGRRRPRLDPWRLPRRDHHQHADCDGERDQRLCGSLEGDHRTYFRTGRALSAARARRVRTRSRRPLRQPLQRFALEDGRWPAGQGNPAGGIGHAHARSLDH